ncbi:hypothetical protein BH11MYX2_BH11MYX2_12530 [soil metagenome]
MAISTQPPAERVDPVACTLAPPHDSRDRALAERESYVATFEQAPSVSTRLAHLQSLLAHPALANAERSALSEILAQAARVLVTTLAEAPSEEHLDVLVAIDQFDLTPFLSRAELAVVTRARQAAAA